MATPPRDPNGRSSLARSSCTSAVGMRTVSSTGLIVESPTARRLTVLAAVM
jgi:hypothetical protein